MGGYERYRVRLSRAGKYRIGLNIIRTGKIGVKGLFLANIRPNIRHILEISLLPLFHPYGRYLALFYIYRLDPTPAYIRHSQSSVFIAEEL